MKYREQQLEIREDEVMDLIDTIYEENFL